MNPNRAKSFGENRPKNQATTPPSTPQGPESNDQLVAPEYRNGPYPGDKPAEPNGEGSPVATHSTGITLAGRRAEKESSHEGNGRPLLDKAGQDPGKKDGREQHEP